MKKEIAKEKLTLSILAWIEVWGPNERERLLHSGGITMPLGEIMCHATNRSAWSNSISSASNVEKDVKEIALEAAKSAFKEAVKVEVTKEEKQGWIIKFSRKTE